MVLQILKSFFAGLENVPGQKPPDAKKLKPFLDLVLSLRKDLPLSIPLLRSQAIIALGKNHETTLLERRIERRYRRLCRISSELRLLDFKKATPGMSPEDYVFSQIDFSRYRKMEEKEFDSLFPEGLTDFDEAFFRKNFKLGKDEVQSVIEKSYRKEEGVYKIQRENPLILSIMRTLDTSLESLDLFTAEEIHGELENLLDFVGDRKTRKKLPGMEQLYPLLVLSLNGKIITHEDGMTTTLFISPKGELSGTFRPGNKPWTLVLIPTVQ